MIILVMNGIKAALIPVNTGYIMIIRGAVPVFVESEAAALKIIQKRTCAARNHN